MDSNKTKIYQEDPLNVILIYICLGLTPIYKFILNIFRIPLRYGPNILTTISLFIGLYSVYNVYNLKYIEGGFLFFLAYIFDVWDGLFARKYKAVTMIGDYYDHICDGVKITLLLFVILFSKDIEINFKIAFVLIFSVLGILTLWHLGCHQKHYKNRTHKEMLDGLKKLCKHEKDIKYSRFFGEGMIMFYMSIFIIYLGCRNI